MAVKDLKNVKPVACYITHEQHAALKAINKQTGIPATVLIRQGVDLIITKHGPAARKATKTPKQRTQGGAS